MGVRKKGTPEFKKKVADFKEGLREMLPFLGEIARDEIVRTTLAGIGENDEPFAPYSPGYAEMIASVGGKTGGVVDLRGLFYKKTSKRPKSLISKRWKTFRTENQKARLREQADRDRRLLRKGGGRQAVIRISVAGRSFFAKTQTTRPRMGLIDPDSEMSADLIKVKVSRGYSIKLVYNSRHQDYMIWHNEGTGNSPRRKWFSLEKTAVRAAVEGASKELFAELARIFNQ